MPHYIIFITAQKKLKKKCKKKIFFFINKKLILNKEKVQAVNIIAKVKYTAGVDDPGCILDSADRRRQLKLPMFIK